ncbi:hypothetical protein L873DRAFT_1788001 [Choiromyces venosus 120613-1]|uniref:BTB domain-containing protein n=1 Tax=Choiromyces venosus 120613-1 TaxID=1336337 RepID=A0A3N4JUF9_9PEZI|nr:hypothetical protein L873DRAFT_1788001 [Choiromyces venosus 120613-1]
MFIRKLQLPLLNVTDADTLVFISPNTSPNPPHRVSSKALLASGSVVFKELLGPTSQHRALRKRKLVNNLPQGIKYVVDLSPPEEGPEALDAVLKLYCPKVVLEWQSGVTNGAYLEDDDHRYQREIWKVDKKRRSADLHKHGVVETVEENCDSISEACSSEAQSARQAIKTADTGIEPVEDQWIEPPPPAAHSTRRHSAAIERILHILHGLDPQLCTTPMWYTVCKVAVLLNCESTVVDHATSWLYADGNFIGKYPEVVMEIANDLKSKILFKDAFAILVGKVLRTSKSDSEEDPHCFDKIPEPALPWKRNIMHACWSLKIRVQMAHVHLLCAPEWLYNSEWIPEYAKLDKILSIPDLDHEVYKASLALRDAITEAIVVKLAPFLKKPWGTGDPLDDNEGLFTRPFWLRLRGLSGGCFWELFDETVSNAQGYLQDCIREYNAKRIKGKRPQSKPAITPRKIFDMLKVRGVISHVGTPRSELSHADNPQSVPPPRRLRVVNPDERRPDRPDSQTLPDDFNALDFQQDDDIAPPNYEPSSEPPPSYTHKDETSEHLVTENTTPRGMRIEIANPIKRKSMFEYSWDGEVAQEAASGEEGSSAVALCVGNSSKRRCSLEKAEDDKASVYSVSTIAGNEDYGEPEVFQISGVHEAIDHQTAPLNYDRKGKGKAVDFEDIREPPIRGEPSGSSLRILPGRTGAIEEDPLPLWLKWTKQAQNSDDPVLGSSWDERELFQELFKYDGDDGPESSSAAGVGAHATLGHTSYDRTIEQNPNINQGYNPNYDPLADPEMKQYFGNCESRQITDNAPPPRISPKISDSEFIVLDTMWKQSVNYVQEISSPFAEILTMYDPTSWPGDTSLLCLSEAEWRYLPLWADGLDDGTGGVFGDPLPEPVPQSPQEDCGEGAEVESLSESNYSDFLLEMESVASFEARVFSEDEGEDMDSMSTSTLEDEDDNGNEGEDDDEDDEDDEDEDEDEEWDGDSDNTEELGWEEC